MSNVPLQVGRGETLEATLFVLGPHFRDRHSGAVDVEPRSGLLVRPLGVRRNENGDYRLISRETGFPPAGELTG